MNRIVQARRSIVLFSLAVSLALFLGSMVIMAGESSQPPIPQAPQATLNPGDNWGNEKIGADLLWQSGSTGAGVMVAVIDSGIDITHPVFSPALVTALDFERSYRDGQGIILDPDDPINRFTSISPDDPLDYMGHGTRMASIIAASGDISRARGVAFGAEILSLKVDYLREAERQDYPFGAGGGDTVTITFDILPPAASDDDVLDIFLYTEVEADLELEVRSPTPTVSYLPDQGARCLTTTTNIPLQGRYGTWQARVTNLDPWLNSFTLTVKRWQWACNDFVTEKAIRDAINQNANVINISLITGPGPLDNAIEDAVDQGIAVVTSAGNVSTTLTSWNRREITVGVTNITDTLMSWSARGPAPDGNTKPDVVAPGHKIYTANSRYSFGPQADYVSLSGSSPSAAHVSGGVAVLIQYLSEINGRPPLPAELKTHLWLAP